MYYISKELEIVKAKKSHEDGDFTYFEEREEINVGNNNIDRIEGEVVRMTEVPTVMVFKSLKKAEERLVELKQDVILHGTAETNIKVEKLEERLNRIVSEHRVTNAKIEEVRKMQQSKFDKIKQIIEEDTAIVPFILISLGLSFLAGVGIVYLFNLI